MNTIYRFSDPLVVVRSILLSIAVLPSFASSLAHADEIDARDESRLTERQTGLANRYQRLEELLLRLAEVEAVENPERSALLRRAARQSRDKFVLDKMRSASLSLKTLEFQNAVNSQGQASDELSSLLKLLLSEDRSKRIRDEKERYAKLAKELKRALSAQRSTRARTENDADLDQLENEQRAISDRTEKLAKRLADENQPDGQASDRASKDNPSGDPQQKSGSDPKDDADPEKDDQPKQPAGDEQPSDSDPDKKDDPKEADEDPPSESSPGQPKSGSQQPSQESPPQQGQSKEGQSKEGQSQPSPQNQSPQTPEQQVEQQLREALQKMREAEQELQNAERQKATEKQRAAEEKLRAAIDQLERILRQLREEEMQRELAKLESRLRKMAAMQSKILDDTVALAATPKSQRDRQTDLKAGDLAFEEKKVSLEADRAMLLLREEGSSVAFPEVVLQIRVDAARVTDFLAETKIDAINQGIQKDILAALEEMIAAIQTAQRDLDKKRQQQQGKPQQGGQREQPLVEALAELKLIRTMEKRIRSTTLRYANLLESGDLNSGAAETGGSKSGDPHSGDQAATDVLPLLQDLSERQNRLYQITRDLVLKRNK